MYSSNKMNRFFPLVLVTFVLLLSSCSERSEISEASDYEIYGYDNRPSVSSVSPTDNSTNVSVSTTVAVTFSKKMLTSSITTNTDNTNCSGSFQLSSDNFTACIKMSAAPVASDNDTTFTATPASTLIAGKIFKTRVTGSVKDTASNSLASAYTTNGFTTACSWSTDITQPSVSSVSPTDNSTYNSPDTTVAVIFSENMATSSVTTNTNDTTCSGSFQLSSDNFTTCIKMSAAPVASVNDTTFTITPVSSLSAVTNFKVKITTSVTDISCNTLGSDNTSIVGFTTSPSGSGTFTGTVQMDNGSALSGVGVSDSLFGSTVATMTSDSNGDFTQASLPLGMHSLTYSKSGYLGLTLRELLETDGETINLETVRLLPDNCTSGTMSGTITDAVTGDNMSGVYLYYTSGLNKNFKWGEWTFFGQTDENGGWSLPNTNYSSSISPGWYTIMSNKSGYYKGYHNAEVCGDISNQDNALSSQLNEGEMRIMLKWPITDPVTGVDLDAHLSIPDNDSTGTFHLYYDVNVGGDTGFGGDYYVYGAGDNVTLDLDSDNTTARPSPPGRETITILSGAATKVRSGTFSYSVHNLTDSDNGTANYKTNLSKSRAKVRVFYNDQGTLVRKRFNVPNDNGTLWRVFTFDSSGSGSGFTRVDNMTYVRYPENVY